MLRSHAAGHPDTDTNRPDRVHCRDPPSTEGSAMRKVEVERLPSLADEVDLDRMRRGRCAPTEGA